MQVFLFKSDFCLCLFLTYCETLLLSSGFLYFTRFHRIQCFDSMMGGGCGSSLLNTQARTWSIKWKLQQGIFSELLLNL